MTKMATWRPRSPMRITNNSIPASILPGSSSSAPMEEYQIVLTVDKVVENMTLTDDQFVVKIPEGTETQNLE